MAARGVSGHHAYVQTRTLNDPTSEATTPNAQPSGQKARRLSIWIALALVSLTAVGAVGVLAGTITRLRHPMRGDFAPFYAAGKLAAAGHAASAYQLRAVDQVEAALTHGHALHLPFPYPPFVEALFGVLARPPIGTSFAIWTALNLAAFAIAGIIALRRSDPEWRIVGVIALLGCLPMVVSTAQGENAGLVTLGFVLSLAGLSPKPSGGIRRQSRQSLNALCLFLGFMFLLAKPQFLIVPLVLLLARHVKRELIAAAVGSGLAVAIGLATGGPGSYAAFLTALRDALKWTTQYHYGPTYNYTIDATLQSFLRFGGVTTVLWVVTSGLVLTWFIARYGTDEFPWLVAAAIGILVANHALFHDIALLYPAAICALGTRLRWVAIALLATPWLDPGMYALVHIHLVVLACVAVVVISVLDQARNTSPERTMSRRSLRHWQGTWKLFVRPRWDSVSGSGTQ